MAKAMPDAGDWPRIRCPCSRFVHSQKSLRYRKLTLLLSRQRLYAQTSLAHRSTLWHDTPASFCGFPHIYRRRPALRYAHCACRLRRYKDSTRTPDPLAARITHEHKFPPLSACRVRWRRRCWSLPRSRAAHRLLSRQRRQAQSLSTHETIRRRGTRLITDSANNLLPINRATESNGVITE